MTVILTFQIDPPFYLTSSLIYWNLISLQLFIFPSMFRSDGIWQLAQSPLLKRLLWSVWEADEGADYNIEGFCSQSLKYPSPMPCQEKKKIKINICPKCNLCRVQPHLLWHLHLSSPPLAAACRMASSCPSGINGIHLPPWEVIS